MCLAKALNDSSNGTKATRNHIVRDYKRNSTYYRSITSTDRGVPLEK